MLKQNYEKDPEILISIVMPAYNAVDTIEESIRSVIKQTYRIWELIIVNDCSADKTVDTVKAFIEKDERIRLIDLEKNRGVGMARNIGVDAAKGDWIAFLDSDDLWTENKLAETISLMNKIPEGKLFFTGSAFIGYDGKRSDYILNVPEKIDFQELLKQNLISCSSVVVDKQSVKECRMPGGELHEDFATWLSILKREKYAYGLNEPLLVYRLSKKSRSGNKWKAAKMNWKTYRKVGVPFFEAVKSMLVYAFRSVKKYTSI